MAVVKMRDLLRTPGPVFEALETGEPFLLTRNGKAVAALFPVDPEEAAEIALAALPEFVERRRRVENARREGKTRTAAEVLEDFATRHPELSADTSGDLSSEGRTTAEEDQEIEAPVLSTIGLLFGSELASELAGEVEERIVVASEPVFNAARTVGFSTSGATEVDERAPAKFMTRIQQLNGELFGRLLPETVEMKVWNVLEAGALAGTAEHLDERGGVLGKQLAEDTLDAVTARIMRFNTQVLDQVIVDESFSLSTYEACIKAAQAIERRDPDDAPAVAGRARRSGY